MRIFGREVVLMSLGEVSNNNQTGNARGRTRKGISRRSVLAAGLAAPLIVPRYVLGGPGNQPPSETLTIACVGVAGMGRNYLAGCDSERIVALCDLDHDLVNKRGVFQKYPKARRYRDYRKMFDKEAGNFDALIIAVPDHSHAHLLNAGIQLGKHIYCAKPITHTIGEARRFKKALLKNPKLITLSSVQSAGTEEARSTTELLNSGAIGPVRELHIWCDHPAYPCSLTRPTEKQSPPEGMDWDIWIGPAPYRPFHSAYHPENWRPWWDFGSGTVGDMACHTLHMFFKELRLEAPRIVYGYASTRNTGFFQNLPTPECQSSANMVTWEYPARGNLPPLNVYWYDGGMKPHRPPELDSRIELRNSGLLFVGEKGKLIAGYYGGNPFDSSRGDDDGSTTRGLEGGLLLPEDKFRDFEQPPKTLRRVEDHYREWTQACKSGKETICPVHFGCEMTEMALLGAVALRTRRVLQWDAENMRVTNNRQANDFLDPPYRKGWEL
jgi:predicted dehydrogenase